jgi:hypothetical protein
MFFLVPNFPNLTILVGKKKGKVSEGNVNNKKIAKKLKEQKVTLNE